MPLPSPEIMSRAAWSCGPQSHLSDPRTSPVKHAECMRTRTGASVGGAPISMAQCSSLAPSVRKTWILERSEAGSGSRADTTPSACSGNDGTSFRPSGPRCTRPLTFAVSQASSTGTATTAGSSLAPRASAMARLHGPAGPDLSDSSGPFKGWLRSVDGSASERKRLGSTSAGILMREMSPS